MIKRKMIDKTIEGFILQLKDKGMTKEASELRTIIAMSRRRMEAVSALAQMAPTFLTHVIKYVAIPKSRSRGDWLAIVQKNL